MASNATAPAIIRRVFEHRREKNGSYSLRAFARDIDLSPSFLSLFLNGKKNLSLNSAYRIGRRLGLEPEEQAALFNAVFNNGNNNQENVETKKESITDDFLDALSFDSIEAKIAVPEDCENEARKIIEDCRARLIELSEQQSEKAEIGSIQSRGRGIIARLSVMLHTA